MLSPKDESALAEAVAAATGPLRIAGGGTRPVGRPVEGETLSVAGLSGITLYEPGALTLVARAGTPLAEVEAALAEEGQRLPFEPMDHRALLGSEGEPTIGGVVAANVSGPRRIQAGACRDSLIGVRFVDGSGKIVKNGGRVMKNVTGYDLVKLMAGSHGTLGVLTEVSFKVLPEPDSAASLGVDGLDHATAVRAMSAALGSPFEVTGAAHGPWGPDGAARTLIRIEGFPDSVAYRSGRLRDLLQGFGTVEVTSGKEAVAAIWRAVGDVAVFADRPVVWRVSVKPSEAPEFLRCIGQTLGCDAALDWGGGLVWIAADEDQLVGNASWDGSGSRDPLVGAEALHATLQEYVRLSGGHATLVKGPNALRAAVPVFQPQPAPLAAIEAGLRARFDPRGILNPGLMA